MARPHCDTPLVLVSSSSSLFFTLEFVIVVVVFFWAFFFPFFSPSSVSFFFWTHMTQFLAATRTMSFGNNSLELSLLISLISLNPPLIYAKKIKIKNKKIPKIFPGEIVELSSCTWTTIIKQLLHYYYYYYYYFGSGKTIYILATKVESFVLRVGTYLCEKIQLVGFIFSANFCSPVKFLDKFFF
jgi:hypothetical protein